VSSSLTSWSSSLTVVSHRPEKLRSFPLSLNLDGVVKRRSGQQEVDEVAVEGVGGAP
jgi:hypothetical protein